MPDNIRSKNSIRNFSIGILSQFVTVIGSLIVRTIFIKELGAQYLGVNGLFTNILMVISLAELGLGNVLLYSLYEPLANNDTTKVNSIIKFYKNIYIKIAIVIFVLGLLLIPFLDVIINSEFSYQQIVLFYMFFLTNSALTYLVADKTALINADQKMYVLKLINAFITLLKDILQIAVLIMTSNFVIYLSIMVITTLLNNIIIIKKTNNMYPYLKLDSNENDVLDTTQIVNDVKSIFLYKIGVVITNNTDNILISIIVGTVYVGYYSNYALIISTISTFLGILIHSIYSSIGNLNNSNEKLKSYNFFKSLVLFFHWLTSFVSISFILVINDFINLWIGSEYLLSQFVVYVIVINFHIQNIINPVWIYRETMGLFKQIRHVMLWVALINLVLSIVLGIKFGLSGILISTALARIFTTVWYEPFVLYKSKFKKPVRTYWISFFKNLVTFIGALIISLSIVGFFSLESNLIAVLLKLIIAFVVTNCFFWILNYKSDELRNLKDMGFSSVSSFLTRIIK